MNIILPICFYSHANKENMFKARSSDSMYIHLISKCLKYTEEPRWEGAGDISHSSNVIENLMGVSWVAEGKF